MSNVENVGDTKSVAFDPTSLKIIRQYMIHNIESMDEEYFTELPDESSDTENTEPPNSDDSLLPMLTPS